MYQIIIWDDRISYAMRLMEYLNHNAKGAYLAVFYQEESQVKEAYEQQKERLLLVSESFQKKIAQWKLTEEQAGTVWYLSETKMKEETVWFRYQRPDRLRQLIELQMLKESPVCSVKKQEIIGVMASLYDHASHQYVMEQIDAPFKCLLEFTSSLDENEAACESEQLLYNIKTRKDMSEEELLSYLDSCGEGVRIKPLRSPFDSRSLAAADFAWFFETLQKCGISHIYVYFDWGTIHDPDVVAVFSRLILLETSGYELRIKNLKDYLGVLQFNSEVFRIG